MTVTLYKATRVDGTDFRTGSIDYAAALASGETIEHPAGAAGLVPGDPSTYISVATVPTACTGMQWPCRLFRIEAAGRCEIVPDWPHKRALSAVRVPEELPAHLALGPQGEEAAALIERARRLTGDDMYRLARSLPPPHGPRTAARGAALDAARDAAWSAAWNAARDAALDAARDALSDAAWDALSDAAWNAVWAVRAVIVCDLISPEHYELFYGLWRDAVEPRQPR